MASTVTTKGQVTNPKKVREHLGIGPGSMVEFELTHDGRVFLVNKGRRRRVKRVQPAFAGLRGSATVKLSTRQIMALTRGEE